MATEIPVLVEQRRGCGYRSVGGYYLVAEGSWGGCCRFPVPLPERCGFCGAGIVPSRGWTWVNADVLLEPVPLSDPRCHSCPLSPRLGQAGLLWVGEKWYATPADFIAEADTRGISRRIPTVPKGFILGTTWVLLAHRLPQPRIFAAFKPQRIEKVVDPATTPEEAAALRKRGITPVIVRPADEQLAHGAEAASGDEPFI